MQLKFTLCNKLRTTADPTATPPAVAAIWLNIDGCWDWACAGAGAEGGAWAGKLRVGGGAALKNSPHRGYFLHGINTITKQTHTAMYSNYLRGGAGGGLAERPRRGMTTKLSTQTQIHENS